MPTEDDDRALSGMEPTLDPLPQPQSEPSGQSTSQQRYVPVLSEVIGMSAASIAAIAPAAKPDAPPPENPAADATVQAVLRTLGPEFDQRLAEAMSRVLHDQLQGLHARVRQAVAREVRAAVVAALNEITHRK